MTDEPCSCREARAWREYWSEDAIRERLTHEVELYQRICAERWTTAFEDSKRPESRLHLGDYPSHAELERRRAQPGTTKGVL